MLLPASKKNPSRTVSNGQGGIPDDVAEELRHLARSKKVGRKRTIFHKSTDSTEIGIPKGFERKTFVVSAENIRRIQAFNEENSLKVRDGINRIFDTFFTEHPVSKGRREA